MQNRLSNGLTTLLNLTDFFNFKATEKKIVYTRYNSLSSRNTISNLIVYIEMGLSSR